MYRLVTDMYSRRQKKFTYCSCSMTNTTTVRLKTTTDLCLVNRNYATNYASTVA